MGDYFSWIETPTKTASIELFSQTTYIHIASIYWLQLSSRSNMSSRKFFDTCPPVHLPPVSLSRCRTLNSREIWRWCSSRSWGSCLDSEPSCFPFRKRYTVLLHTTLGIASVAKEYVSYFWHIRYRNSCGHFGLYWSEPCLMFNVGLDDNEMHEGHEMSVVLGYNAYDCSRVFVDDNEMLGDHKMRVVHVYVIHHVWVPLTIVLLLVVVCVRVCVCDIISASYRDVHQFNGREHCDGAGTHHHDRCKCYLHATKHITLYHDMNINIR